MSDAESVRRVLVPLCFAIVSQGLVAIYRSILPRALSGMADRLILHIGMHKTGTTAVQEALAGYDDGDTRMAALRHPNHSIQMLTCFAQDPTKYHVWVRQGIDPDRVLRIRAAMRRELLAELALPRRQLVISGEEMSLMRPPSVQEMADFCAPFAAVVSVLAWLRPAVGYIGSALQQMIRAGQATALLPRPCYRTRFAQFSNRYGRGAMTYRLYQAGGSTVTEFCDLLGIPPQAVQDRRDNVSLSDTAMRLIWLLNRTGPTSTGSAARLTARTATIRHLARRFPGRFALPPDLAAAGIDRADIAWAEGETGLTLSDGIPDIDPAVAQQRLEAWLGAVGDEVEEALDQDLDRLGLNPTRLADLAERLAALYRHYLAIAEAEAEVKSATVTIFRAGNREAGASIKARIGDGAAP